MPFTLTDSLVARFWQRTNVVSGHRVAYVDSDCWLWTGMVTTGGYGAIESEGQPRRAHIVSWRLHKGDVPDGMCVLHRCDVRRCVNPDHLWLGTKKQNSVDMVQKGRSTRRTHCLRGHEFTEENTILKKEGGRKCAKCALDAQRKLRALHPHRQAQYSRDWRKRHRVELV